VVPCRSRLSACLLLNQPEGSRDVGDKQRNRSYVPTSKFFLRQRREPSWEFIRGPAKEIIDLDPNMFRGYPRTQICGLRLVMTALIQLFIRINLFMIGTIFFFYYWLQIGRSCLVRFKNIVRRMCTITNSRTRRISATSELW